MPKCKKVQTTEYRLSLTAIEAAWLMSLLQNPLGCSLDEENSQDRNMRQNLWNALSDADAEA